jgi:hypothetical protein
MIRSIKNSSIRNSSWYRSAITNNRINTDQPFKAFGGEISTSVVLGVTYVTHQFRNANSAADEFKILSTFPGKTMDVLIVAGGGGGGGGCCNVGGGGGGGGGMLEFFNVPATAGSYRVVVGAGGVANTNGEDSIFSSLPIAYGGGGGGNLGIGRRGGSGGGGAGAGTITGGIAGQGNQSGDSGGTVGINQITAGGGGGKTSAGSGRNPGAGATSTILTGTTFSGGGFGGISNDGGTTTGTPAAKAANTGTGGDGMAGDNSGTGGAGGSGIVVVRYAI